MEATSSTDWEQSANVALATAHTNYPSSLIGSKKHFMLCRLIHDLAEKFLGETAKDSYERCV
eukprot:scaffold73275_cov21-Prasinocladus_malaysianus.AAC.2